MKSKQTKSNTKKSKVPDSLMAPAHLHNGTRAWWESVNDDFDLEPHQVKLLTLACEAWDRCVQARKAVSKHGLTSTNRYGEVRVRPEVGVERDSRIAFARLLRELNLDVEEPVEARPPGLKYRGR